MLDRLIPLIPSRAREALRALFRRPAARAAEPGPAIRPDTRPGPMRPLHPPAAINDNPLGAIEAAVEDDLRRRGYLR